MLGNYRTAVADAESAVQLKPSSAEMMHNAACIFAQASFRREGDLKAEDGHTLSTGYRRRAPGGRSKSRGDAAGQRASRLAG